jgi:hypothetical protein
MPIENLGTKHLTAAPKTAIDDATGFAAKVAELKQFFPRTGTGTTTPANKT